MNGPDAATGGRILRNHQQNTAGESNPAHFSVNGIRAGVSLDDSDNHFARIHRQIPLQDSTIVLFRYIRTEN
jgi:hypothetical protein